MSGAPEVSVVIPTAGRRPAVLRDTIASLGRQTFDMSRAEILVVFDGAAADESLADGELAGEAPVRVWSQPRQGQGVARNTGIAHARAPIVLMLDDDILASPHLVEAHLCRHRTRGDVVVTGALPVERNADAPAHERVLRRWWDEVLAEMASPWHRSDFRDFVTGNVSVRRERLLAVGGFDPAFHGYGREDYELGYRLQRAGMRFEFEPRAVGLHRYRKDVLEWLRQSESMGRADVIFARKHPEIMGEVMTLSTYPPVPWNARTLAAAERMVAEMNARGGLAWKKSAGYAQSAYYWKGVRTETRDARELRTLLRAMLERRSVTGRIGVRGKLYVAYAGWALQ